VGFSDFLAEAGTSRPPKEPLQVIRQSRGAATIVKNLLSSPAARRRAHLQPISDAPGLDLALRANQLMAHKVEAAWKVEPGLPDVEVNANQIKQVVRERDQQRVPGDRQRCAVRRIWITARRVRDSIAVSVTGLGPRMTEDSPPRVRAVLSGTNGKARHGTGLLHQPGDNERRQVGDHPRPRPGGGATFTLSLRSARAPRAPRPRRCRPASRSSLSILVVDDERTSALHAGHPRELGHTSRWQPTAP